MDRRPLVAEFIGVPGATVASLSPCQMATLGQGPAYPGCASRTAWAQAAGVRSAPGLMQLNAETTSTPQPYGIPATTAPAANTSG